MNLFTHFLHLAGSGATAYLTARNLRDRQTRPNLLAGFQLAESGSVPFLTALSDRAAAEGDSWLADQLSRHAHDENRHGRIFAQALKQLNKQVIDFSQVPKTKPNGEPDERRRSPFFAAYFEGYSQESLRPETIDWLVFFGSTYTLELDACNDFARMASVLPENESDSLSLKKGLLSIAQDEQRHAAYLREAMLRRMPYSQALALMDEWRTRKVNAMIAMVTNLIQKQGQMPSLVQEGMPSEAEPEIDVQDLSKAAAELTPA